MTATLAADDLDPFVESFERQHGRTGAADLADFLPPRDHPLFGRVLAELVRVDMEYSWRAGRRRAVDEYLSRFPELREAGLGEVCFEEYRLRRRAGECPHPDEFRARYGVDTSHWPPPVGDTQRGFGSTAVEPRTAIWAGEDPASSDAFKAPECPVGPEEFPVPGSVFLGYELVEELGQGAFGRVYLARESALAARWVVLKVTGDVRHESRSLARLQHTNIVPIFSQARAGALGAMCMPYCGATSLADVTRALRKATRLPVDGAWLVTLVRSSRRVPAEGHECTMLLDQLAVSTYADAVLALVARLAEGLAHAHDRGIVHRDLKPANVLLGDDGEPRLLDFNLADDARAASSAALVGGTLPYMAPEQLRAFDHGAEAMPADGRSDVYSFGLIMFELLTGRLPAPVPTGSVTDICRTLAASRAASAHSARAANRQVTPAFDAIIRKCLDPNPSRRYTSARPLAEDLRCQVQNLPLCHARDASLLERLRKWGRRHPRLASGYGVAALAAVILATVGAALASARLSENRRALRDELATARLALSAPHLPAAVLQRRLDSGQRVWDRPTGAAARADRGELAFWLARAERLAARAATRDERDKHERAALHWNDEAGRLVGDGALGRAIRLQRSRVLRDDALTRDVLSQPLRGPTDQLVAAVDAMDAGDFAQARALLDAAVTGDPQSAVAWYALGLCLQNLDQHASAVGRFDTCIALTPEFASARHLRGSSLLQIGRTQDALRELDRAHALEPNDLAIRIDRAIARLTASDLTGAEADVTAAIEGGYDETHVYFLRARIRQRAGNPAAAGADRREGFERNPRSERDWIARAVARLPGDPKAALSDLDRCIELFPSTRLALENKAHVLCEYLRRPGEATAVLDRVVASHPTSALAHSGRGVLRARSGDFVGARADADRALALEERPLVWYQVAGIFALTAQDRPADRDRAVYLLGKALHHDVGLDLFETDPELESVRRLAEVQKLVAASKWWKNRTARGG